jgi:hypothetical protein
LISNILKKNPSKNQIRKLFEEESKILKNFIKKINMTIENEKEKYPYPKKKEIKFKEKNIIYTLRKYLINILKNELFDEVDFSDIKFDILGCMLISEIIKKCGEVYLLRLNNCYFPENGLQEILNSLDYFDDFYTIELNGVKLNINNRKHIALINKDNKKKIVYDDIVNKNAIIERNYHGKSKTPKIIGNL